MPTGSIGSVVYPAGTATSRQPAKLPRSRRTRRVERHHSRSASTALWSLLSVGHTRAVDMRRVSGPSARR